MQIMLYPENVFHMRMSMRMHYLIVTKNQNISTKNNAEFIEVRANAFAAAFLMPAEGISGVLRSLNKGKSSRQDQVIFDVSANSKMSVESRSAPYSQNITFSRYLRL